MKKGDRFFIGVIVIWLTVFCFTAYAEEKARWRYDLLGQEDLVLDSSSVSGFVASSGTSEIWEAWVCVQGDDVRYKIGANPSADNGNILSEGSCLTLESPEESDDIVFTLKTGGSGATINATFFGYGE